MRLIKLLLLTAPLLLGSGCNTAPVPMDSETTRRAIGVNAYLWRAALDTLSFLPLVTVDPFGGVIISDWYTPQGTSGEKLKVTVHIADRALRPDAIKVTVFRQERSGGDWSHAPPNPATARLLEDRILTRARRLAMGTILPG